MKRNIKYPSGRREEAVGASLCLQDTQPILELRDEIKVSLAGFSRHREKVSVFPYRERGFLSEFRWYRGLYAVRPKLTRVDLGLFVFKKRWIYSVK